MHIWKEHIIVEEGEHILHDSGSTPQIEPARCHGVGTANHYKVKAKLRFNICWPDDAK